MNKACQNIFILRKLQPICSQNDLPMIFQSKIASVIEYGLSCVINVSKKSMNPVFSINKRCHQIININNQTMSSFRNFNEQINKQVLSYFYKFANDPILCDFMPQKSITDMIKKHINKREKFCCLQQ